MTRIVFVDPQDNSTKHWWPALVVPKEDYDLFFREMGPKVETGEDILVCYFEDASYSVVKESETREFNISTEPYVSWVGDKEFSKRKSVKLALIYLYEQKVPPKFKWLRRKNRRTPPRQNTKRSEVVQDASILAKEKSTEADSFSETVVVEEAECNLSVSAPPANVAHASDVLDYLPKKKIWKENALKSMKRKFEENAQN